MRQSYHHGDLARLLIEEGRTALLTNPDPEQLSIRDLARRVGVSQNAPYRHFATRTHLLAAIAARGYEVVAASLAEGSDEGARGVATVWTRMATAEPGVMRLMMTAADNPLVATATRGWLAEVVRAIAPQVGDDDPERLVRLAIACWGSVVGMTTLQSGGLLAGLDNWLIPDPGSVATQLLESAGR